MKPGEGAGASPAESFSVSRALALHVRLHSHHLSTEEKEHCLPLPSATLMSSSLIVHHLGRLREEETDVLAAPGRIGKFLLSPRKIQGLGRPALPLASWVQGGGGGHTPRCLCTWLNLYTQLTMGPQPSS